MKTLKNTIKIAIGVLVLGTMMTSCVQKQESLGSAGQTLVKLNPSGFNMVAVDAKTTPQTAVLFDVMRNVNSQASLSQATTVVLQFDTDGAMLAAYNTANSKTFIPLPVSLATTVPAIVAGKITLEFGANDFAKSVSVNIPASANFDFSKQYALTFKLIEVTGTGTMSEAVGKTIVVQVLAKNKWDGVYDVDGTYVDYIYAPGAYAGYYPKVIQLRTTGSVTCSRYEVDFATYAYAFDPYGDGQYWSSFGGWTPSFMFDASDNVVDCINTTLDPAPRSRTALLYTGAGSINKYFSATKTMDVTFQLKALTTTPQIRNLITEHYVYKGPR
jgi:hypothetical protein